MPGWSPDFLKRIPPLLPAILWAAAILILYALPGKSLPDFDWMDLLQADKIGHFGVFMILGILLPWGIRQKYFDNKEIRRSYIMGLLVCVIYGSILELIQGTIFEDRHTEWLDLIANVAGSVVGIVIFRWICRKTAAE